MCVCVNPIFINNIPLGVNCLHDHTLIKVGHCNSHNCDIFFPKTLYLWAVDILLSSYTGGVMRQRPARAFLELRVKVLKYYNLKLSKDVVSLSLLHFLFRLQRALLICGLLSIYPRLLQKIVTAVISYFVLTSVGNMNQNSNYQCQSSLAVQVL